LHSLHTIGRKQIKKKEKERKRKQNQKMTDQKTLGDRRLEIEKAIGEDPALKWMNIWWTYKLVETKPDGSEGKEYIPYVSIPRSWESSLSAKMIKARDRGEIIIKLVGEIPIKDAIWQDDCEIWPPLVQHIAPSKSAPPSQLTSLPKSAPPVQPTQHTQHTQHTLHTQTILPVSSSPSSPSTSSASSSTQSTLSSPPLSKVVILQKSKTVKSSRCRSCCC
jgi:hypothetical protein